MNAPDAAEALEAVAAALVAGDVAAACAAASRAAAACDQLRARGERLAPGTRAGLAALQPRAVEGAERARDRIRAELQCVARSRRAAAAYRR